MIIGQFTPGICLDYISHEVASATKCVVILSLTCWFAPMFVTVGPILPLQCAYLLGLALLVIGTIHSPVLEHFFAFHKKHYPCMWRWHQLPSLQMLPYILHCIVWQQTWVSVMTFLVWCGLSVPPLVVATGWILKCGLKLTLNHLELWPWMDLWHLIYLFLMHPWQENSL